MADAGAPDDKDSAAVPVGFVGLGAMGRPMARRLAGRPAGLWVHDVDPAAVAALEEVGATAAGSVRELAARARLISVMVRDDAQVREVVGAILGGAGPGTVIAVHSTIHADTARSLAALAARSGVHLLDAPVSGGALGARDGRLAVLVGGEPDAFELARGYLGRMGEVVELLGPVGAGTAAKLARNMLHFTAFAATGEALRLAAAAGIDLPTLGRIVRHTDAVTGGPGAVMLRDSVEPVPPGNPWYGILGNVRSLGEKDLGLAVELAAALGVDTPLARLALDTLGENLGLGRSDA